MGMKVLQDLALSESGFVFDPRSGSTFLVNGSGKIIIEGLRRDLTRQEIEAEIRKTLEVSEDMDIQSDLVEFCIRLKDEGLVGADFDCGGER